MRTIRYLIDQRAAQFPEKVYMFAPEPGLELSYAQLKADSRKFGKHLLKRGLKKGDKISFMMGNGYQTTKIFLGTMYAGLVVAPLNFLAQAAQLEYVLDHSDTRLVFFGEDQKVRLETACKAVARDIELIRVDNDAPLIFPGDEDVSGIDLPEVTVDDDALLLYTSGTTGLPKGVILSHKNMVADGFVFVTGRIKELIIKGGENISFL
jgi:long-chain acyl-CoA synthetase